MDGPKVSLVVMSHNQIKYSKMMYSSLRNYTRYPYELVWLDCVSTDGTRGWLKSDEHAETVKVFVPKMGIGEAMNVAFKRCDPDSKYVGQLDNDIILTEGWLTKFVNHMEGDEGIGACSARATYAYHGHQPFTPKNVDNLEQEIQEFARKMGGRRGVRVVDWVNGSHTLYRRAAVEQVGLWNPAFWMGQDKDIGIRLTRAGWKCVATLDTWVYHFHQTTTKEIDRTDPEWRRRRRESQALLKRLYGS